MSWFQRAVRVVQMSRAGSRQVTEPVDTRANCSAQIVQRLGFNRLADGVGTVDERWDGAGQPHGLRAARSHRRPHHRAGAVRRGVRDRSGPGARAGGRAPPARQVVRPHDRQGRRRIEHLLAHWTSLDTDALRREVREREPGDAALLAGPGTLDCIAQGFADVVDAKSPFTAQHSSRVSDVAIRIAKRLGFSAEQRAGAEACGATVRHRQLSVPNSILDKPGPLTPRSGNRSASVLYAAHPRTHPRAGAAGRRGRAAPRAAGWSWLLPRTARGADPPGVAGAGNGGHLRRADGRAALSSRADGGRRVADHGARSRDRVARGSSRGSARRCRARRAVRRAA